MPRPSAAKLLHDYLVGMRSTMPQDAPGGLSDVAYVDVLAYILAENGYPTGDVRLVANADALKAIRIEADFLERVREIVVGATPGYGDPIGEPFADKGNTDFAIVTMHQRGDG